MLTYLIIFRNNNFIYGRTISVLSNSTTSFVPNQENYNCLHASECFSDSLSITKFLEAKVELNGEERNGKKGMIFDFTAKRLF